MNRTILLNSISFEIKDIVQRAINPWKAKVVSRGLEYSDFSQAELEEWHDFRNGIGLESALPDESARLWWSEGIDFSTPRSAVLGPLVTTAGSFGVAPVKIIDFRGGTYAIGSNLIAKWNAGTPGWDTKHVLLTNPIDAIVVTDGTDEYLVVSSATESTYTTDGEAWGALLTFTEVDANSKLTVTANKATAADADTDEDVQLYKDFGAAYFDAIDENFELYIASTSVDNGGAGVAVSNTVGAVSAFANTDISVIAERRVADCLIRLLRGNAVAADSYVGSTNTIYYCTLTRVAGADTVTVTIYSDSDRGTLVDTLSVAGFSTTTYRYLYGFVNLNSAGGGGEDFDGYTQMSSLTGCRGYLAFYNTKLRGISTTGGTVYSSPANDIDGIWTNFSLTGQFGTV